MRNGEKGQALVIVLALVAFGGLVITPFLGNAGSGLIGSRIYGEAIDEQYSSDAGVEHAIWDLTYGDLASQISDPGDNVTYQLGETICGIIPAITVVREDSSTYEITSVAAESTIEATVAIAGTTVTVLWWHGM